MKAVWLLVCLALIATAADDVKVTPVMTKDLAGIAGKEATMVTVEYAPGASSAVHRHNANTFVYVLEGSVVMQVKGGKELTLGPGQMFYDRQTISIASPRTRAVLNPRRSWFSL
jgi:quercetin dioxygenase-like cupin family protein